MKTVGIETDRAQLGWIARWCFAVTTADQFTDQLVAAEGRARWHWLAIVKAWWAARRLDRQLRAQPGERERLGWAK